MSLEHVKPSTDIFDIGDEGDLFYLILDGIVEVWVPEEAFRTDFNRCKLDIIENQKYLEELHDKLVAHHAKVKEMEDEIEFLLENNKKKRSVVKIDTNIKQIAIEHEESFIHDVRNKI